MIEPATDFDHLVASFRAPDPEPEPVVIRDAALLRRAARLGLVREPPCVLWFPGSNMRSWWSLQDRPAVICRDDRWSWVAPGATYDETRHAPTFDTETQALAAIVAWLDTPADRRPDWLAGRRPDWLRPRREEGRMIDTVSALYVRADGPYPALVADWWDEARDARLYAGPNPVVAHPPCKRWCLLAPSVEALYGYKVGDDGGTFESALSMVRRWGGVLEHPAETLAWKHFGLPRPMRGWSGDLYRPNEWVTEVCQRNYGHRAEKRTWLLLVGQPFALDWREPARPEAWCSADRPMSEMTVELMGKRERELTPEPFARLLVGLAATAVRVAA